MESIYAKSDQRAQLLNQKFTNNHVFAINMLGAPGVGKTSCLLQIIQRLECKSFVIEGDIASDLDTQQLLAHGIEAVQINTGGACHLDTLFIEDAMKDKQFRDGFVFIENIGNLVCPAEFMIGEHIKLLICSVTDGSDKPYKYPLAFEKADVILLNKCDLLQHLDFNKDFYLAGVKKLNPNVPVFHVSAKTGEGFTEVTQWLSIQAKSVQKELQ